MTFDLDRFVAAARDAAAGPRAVSATLALMRETVADPGAVARGLPAGVADDAVFFEDPTVYVSFARFHPGRVVPPHDHRVAAFIGVFRGVEVNHLYRAGTHALRRVSSRRVAAGETLSIGPDGIHAVEAGDAAVCEALHVYLGPLGTVERHLYHPDTGVAMPFDDDNYAAMETLVNG